ncbi:MAG: HIT domain-containing protein [Geobacter sp.]|nr:HIT domain-containing protein [Geobacter sp.]
MELLRAPWRMGYITADKVEGCIFCVGDDAETDRERLIIHRSQHTFVMLNLYPYTNGHLLAVPFRHTAELDHLTDPEMLDFMKTVRLCRAVLAAASTPQGYNLGMNLGKAGGAGVDEHLHMHVVPRWNGDTNYMSVVAEVRVVPEALLATYDRLRPLFDEISSGGAV